MSSSSALCDRLSLRHLNPKSDVGGHKNTSFDLDFRSLFFRRTFPFGKSEIVIPTQDLFFIIW